jgi:hypothetical protein
MIATGAKWAMNNEVGQFENSLLSMLSRGDADRLLKVAKIVELNARGVLEVPYEQIPVVLFPTCGILSVDAVTRSGFAMQIAMIGSEGASAMALTLGNNWWPHTTRAFTDVVGVSVEASDFRALLSASYQFRNAMLRYTSVVADQMASAALASGRCTIPQRLARWILQMQDRSKGRWLTTTHEEVAYCLGTRRAGVTMAVHVLEGQHLIRSTRAQIEVLDRAGLYEASSGCYRERD